MQQTIATDQWGIDDGYLDVKGEVHGISSATRQALLRAMGLDPDRPEQPPASGSPGDYADVVVLRGQRPWSAPAEGELLLEDGTSSHLSAQQEITLPLGYHQFTPGDAVRPIRVIAAPLHCHLPDDLRLWGWAAQLYATRSRQSWGIG